MTDLRWGRYLRVSSEEQAVPGMASVPTQDTDTAAMIAREGGVVVDTYPDVKKYYVGPRKVEPSGERTDRPEWLRMLADIRSGRINAVAGWHSSRLYRNYRPAIDFLELVEEFNVHVRLVTESFDPRWAMLQAWRDREDNKNRVDKMHFGRQGMAKKGFSPTRHSKFYVTLRDELGDRIGCDFRAEYRGLFDELARLFLEGHSYEVIAQRLGTNPTSGIPFSPTLVQTIFKNPWYRGLVDYGRGALRRNSPRFVAEGKHPAAWPPEVLVEIDRELARRKALAASRPHRGTAPLAGLLRCGYCGHLLSGQTYPAADGRRWTYNCQAVHAARRGWLRGPGLPHVATSLRQSVALREIDTLLHRLATQPAAERQGLFGLIRRVEAVTPPSRAGLDKHRRELDSLPADAETPRALMLALIEKEQAAYDAALVEYESSVPVEPIDQSAIDNALALAVGGELVNRDHATQRAILTPFRAFYFQHETLVPVPDFSS